MSMRLSGSLAASEGVCLRFDSYFLFFFLSVDLSSWSSVTGSSLSLPLCFFYHIFLRGAPSSSFSSMRLLWLWMLLRWLLNFFLLKLFPLWIFLLWIRSISRDYRLSRVGSFRFTLLFSCLPSGLPPIFIGFTRTSGSCYFMLFK